MDKKSETSNSPKEKVKNIRKPPRNPNYKPTIVNMDDFCRRLRAGNREALRRAGIWLY
ncbi:hypothetical protein [Planococcus donghaensis]|uniref:hypothetical protein n=1 Tax=Planococcus donghaensis TaxID=414778 RepID=UPI0037355BD4